MFIDEIKLNILLEEFYVAIATDEEYEEYFCLTKGEKPPFIFNYKAYLKALSQRMTYKEFKEEFVKYLEDYIKDYYSIEHNYWEYVFYLYEWSETYLTYDEYVYHKLTEYEKDYENYVKEYLK